MQRRPGLGLARRPLQQLPPDRRVGRQAWRGKRQGNDGAVKTNTLQMRTGQFEQGIGVALYRQQADLDGLRRPVLQFERQAEPLDARILAHQKRGQLLQQALERKGQPRQGMHRLVEFEGTGKTRRRPMVIQRQRPLPAQLAQMAQQAATETSGQGAARQPEQLAQALEAAAFEGLHDVLSGIDVRQPGTVEAQRGQRRLQPGVVHRQSVVDIDQHPRRRRIGRDHQPMRKAEFGELRPQPRLQPRPGAQQIEAAGDLEHQRVRIVQADLGAETVGPARQTPPPALDGLGIERCRLEPLTRTGSRTPIWRGVGRLGKRRGVGRLKKRRVKQRFGEASRLAGPDALLAGGAIGGPYALALRRTIDQREGRLGIGASA